MQLNEIRLARAYKAWTEKRLSLNACARFVGCSTTALMARWPEFAECYAAYRAKDRESQKRYRQANRERENKRKRLWEAKRRMALIANGTQTQARKTDKIGPALASENRRAA